MTEAEGAAAAEGTPVEGAQAGGGMPGSGTHDPGDYMARISNEPEFAVDQIKDKDRKISSLNERLKGLEGVDELVEAAGSVDNLRGYVTTGFGVLQRPELNKVVEEALRTGVVPGFQTEPQGDAVDDDPYGDPDIKELRKTITSLTDKLETMSQQNDQRFAQAETRGSMAIVNDNVDKVLETYGVNDEIRSKLSETISRKVKEAEMGARQGNQQHLNLLNTLAGPQGVETMKMMTLGVIEENMEAIVAARQNGAARSAQAHSTETPSPVRTAGGDSGHSEITPVGDWVRRRLEENTKRAGRDPAKIWHTPLS